MMTPARFVSPTWACARANGSSMSTTFPPSGAWTCASSRSPAPRPGLAYPRCTGGHRAGTPEDWDGPWVFLERTQPHLVLGATVRAAEIIGQLLDADDHDDLAGVGVNREELAALIPLLGLERFDRRACNQVLRGLAVGVRTVEGSRA